MALLVQHKWSVPYYGSGAFLVDSLSNTTIWMHHLLSFFVLGSAGHGRIACSFLLCFASTLLLRVDFLQPCPSMQALVNTIVVSVITSIVCCLAFVLSKHPICALRSGTQYSVGFSAESQARSKARHPLVRLLLPCWRADACCCRMLEACGLVRWKGCTCGRSVGCLQRGEGEGVRCVRFFNKHVRQWQVLWLCAVCVHQCTCSGSRTL